MSFPKTLEWKQIQFSDTKSFPWYNSSFCRAQVKPEKIHTGVTSVRIYIQNENSMYMLVTQGGPQTIHSQTPKIYHPLFQSPLVEIRVCFFIQSLTNFSMKIKREGQVYRYKWGSRMVFQKSPGRKVCHLCAYVSTPAPPSLRLSLTTALETDGPTWGRARAPRLPAWRSLLESSILP